jgi:hypothetical protein
MQNYLILFLFVLALEIKLSRGEGWDPIFRINPASLLWLSQVWVSNVICRVFNELR